MSVKVTTRSTQNGLELSCLYKGYIVHKKYMYYTLKEALHLFKEYLRTL